MSQLVQPQRSTIQNEDINDTNENLLQPQTLVLASTDAATTSTRTEAPPERTIGDVQQEFFELYGHKTEIIYDLYNTTPVLYEKMRLFLGIEQRKNELELEFTEKLQSSLHDDKNKEILQALWIDKMKMMLAKNEAGVKAVSEKIKELSGVLWIDRIKIFLANKEAGVKEFSKKTKELSGDKSKKGKAENTKLSGNELIEHLDSTLTKEIKVILGDESTF